MFLLSAAAPADPITGNVKVGSYPPVQFVDGWIASDSSDRYLKVILVPYACPRRVLDEARPHAELTGWFEKDYNVAGLKMAGMYVHGVPKSDTPGYPTQQYTATTPDEARKFFSNLRASGRKITISSSVRGARSAYPKTPPGSWTVNATLTRPGTP